MLWNSIGSLVYLGCQWAITVVVVRLSSGYSEAGVLSLAMSIGNIFTPFAIYKMRTFQVSDVTGEYSAGQYMAFRLITVAFAFVGCMAYTVVTCQPNAYLSITLYLIYKAVDIVIDVMHGLDQQHLRMDYIGVSQIIRGVLSLSSFSLTLYFTQSLDWAIAAMIVATIPVGVLYDYRVARRFESLKPSISLGSARKLLVLCLPAVAAAVFCSAVLTIPRQYLSVAFGTDALGIYSSVAAPVVIIQMGVTYLYNPLLGYFSKYYSEGDYSAFKNMFLKVLGGIVLITLICMVGFEVAGAWALELLYGESIIPYTYLLQPMAICTVVTGFLWFMSDLLISMRSFRGNFIGNLISILSAVPLSFLLVSLFDMNGVSFTGIAAYGLGALVLLVFMTRSLREIRRRGNGGV